MLSSLTNIDSSRRFHAWILEGENLGALFNGAKAKCAALLCEQDGCGHCPACRKTERGEHPDISILRSDDKLIPVSAVRALRSDMWVRPNEGRVKIIVLGDAARLNIPAQNALLNLIEEPPPYGIILLLTTSRGALLPTIRSRCVCEHIGGESAVPVDENTEILLSALIKKDELAVLRAVFLWEKLPRNEFEAALGYFRIRLSEILIENKSLTRAQVLRMIDIAASHSAALGVNAGAGHICGAMAAELWESLSIDN